MEGGQVGAGGLVESLRGGDTLAGLGAGGGVGGGGGGGG